MDITMQYYIVFTNETDLPVLKLLKSGFRHCFILIKTRLGFIAIDPLSNRTVVEVPEVMPEFDLPLFFKQQGCKVLAVKRSEPPPKPLLPLPCSCVETVKRLIGLRAVLIFTPYALYRYLKKRKDLSWEV
jgi:hypothetical protein